ncbi:MAG: glycosyltransferase family 2 protein [Synergistaceae bacterium]|nr:glycosyltransferase family 2 protein [Synergistaceae bacterium]
MSDNNRPAVSFCIPVYNNAEAAVKIVQGLLVSDNQDFEVVVSDDASKDNAQELLSQIHDPRFKYYRNEKNLGAHQNWLHSLELGHGEWLYLVMARDQIHGENIDRLIKILKYAHENNIYYLKDGYKWTGELEFNDIEVLTGIDSMINFLLVIHPS